MNRNRIAATALLVPAFLFLGGIAWIELSARAYQRSTGRDLHGLAAHSTDTGIDYQQNGREILRNVIVIPVGTTFLALLVSLIISLAAGTELPGWFMPGTWLLHVGGIVAFALFAARYWLDVVGVFI
jgi:hypothetical protein